MAKELSRAAIVVADDLFYPIRWVQFGKVNSHEYLLNNISYYMDINDNSGIIVNNVMNLIKSWCVHKFVVVYIIII